MKKRYLAVFLIASSLAAQVQIGKNVQIGGTASGSSFTLNSISGATTISVGAGLSLSTVGSNILIQLTSPVAPLTIASFTGGQSGELGQSFVNPSFAATYGGTPTSANITNTEAIDSPHTLITPFTSGAVTGNFVHTTVTTTTFTLHATDGTYSPTANQTITWNPRIFAGVGTPGATSSVTSSGTTAVLSNASIIQSAGLGTEAVGQTLATVTPSGQSVYLLLIGGTHTFIDAGTGFPFAFNTPLAVTFVNAQGVTVSMFLYQSTNPLFGTYTPKVAS